MQIIGVANSPCAAETVDPCGFLSSLGVKDVCSMMRDDLQMAKILKPKLASSPGFVRFAQSMNPSMLAGKKPPALSCDEAEEGKEGAFLRKDHAGLGDGKDAPPSYGTYSIAMRLGFTNEQAERIARANASTDRGAKSSLPLHSPSRHFNSNIGKSGTEDSRLTWARYHLKKAVELARSGLPVEAENELGYGLHSLQDAFAHAQISPMTHVLIGKKVDSVSLYPAAINEAAVATEAYLRRYLSAISDIP